MPEEAIHFTLLQLKKPEHILIVSGGKNGMIGEVLKYPSFSMSTISNQSLADPGREPLLGSLTFREIQHSQQRCTKMDQ